MRKFLYTLAAVFTLFTCIADETQKNNPLVYQSGIYINRINSFDMKSGIAEVDFWYWVITEKEEASLQNLELSNGKLEPLGEVIRQQLGDKFYASRRYIATANCLIDTSRFPFDKQSITLSFEDGAYTSDQMTFKPDINNSGIDPAFKMNEWTITNVSYNVGGHNYPTSFGYLDIPSGQSSDYSQFCVNLELERTGSMLQKLFKYFWASFYKTKHILRATFRNNQHISRVTFRNNQHISRASFYKTKHIFRVTFCDDQHIFRASFRNKQNI